MKQSGTDVGTALNMVSNQMKFAQDRIVECEFCETFI